MKKFLLILSLVATAATAQSVSVGPDGSTLVVATVTTNTFAATKTQLRSAEAQLAAEIAKLQAQLKEVQGYIAMAETLKVADAKPMAVSTNAPALSPTTSTNTLNLTKK